MRIRAVAIVLTLFLAGCATQQSTSPAVSPTAKAPHTCADTPDLWTQYVAGTHTWTATEIVHCAETLDLLDSLLTQALSETRKSANRPAFHTAAAFVRAAALSGNGRAQRALSNLYASKAGWYGRNAYLALFWRGVVRKSDPSYSGHPDNRLKLETFKTNLSRETKRDLADRIFIWESNDPAPPRLTSDTLITYAIEAQGQVTPAAIENIIDYGFAEQLRDADIMALIAKTRELSAEQRIALYERHAARGSFLALVMQFHELRQLPSPDEHLYAELIFAILDRLGLDPTTLQEDLFDEAETFATSGEESGLRRLLTGKSRPQQRTIAMLTLVWTCRGGATPLCATAMDTFEPILPQTSKMLIRVLRVTQHCRSGPNVQRCIYQRNGFGAIRDLFAFDYLDVSGQET